MEEGRGGADGALDIPGGMTVAVEPGEGSLDDPTARMDGEAGPIGESADDPDVDQRRGATRGP